MPKFYRVIKDHPLWEVGAILSNEQNSERYKPIDDLWTRDIKGIDDTYYETANVVENQPEWFEHVYKVNVLKQVKYLSKTAARQMHDELYQ